MIAYGCLVPDDVIEVEGLTRRFGAKLALADVRLAVPRGAVFGLVGANGAGKTTLIKHLLGLLRPQAGTVRVLGGDPVADPAGVLARVGYLSEENDLPGWMRVGELLRYTRAFYPGWDPDYAEELRRAFELDLTARVRTLSKGQRARVGLVAALAHRPELLVLDEPSSGLDPLVRRDILEAIIRTIAEEGRTVLFSSHLLHEVERVSDHVALIHQGRIVFSAALDDVREEHRCLTLHFEEPRAQPPALAGAIAWQGTGREWTALVHCPPRELVAGGWASLAAGGGRVVEERTPTLDEIFVARVGKGCLTAEED
jgi:ABC-2 type transport system ATP-binding protein